MRGKILNVVSATKDKIKANSEIQDIVQALGTGLGDQFDLNDLRYERVIIMTDADVDGAHIAALLMTLFYSKMRPLIEAGHLYLARPPLYRLVSGTLSAYAHDDAHKDELMETMFKGKKKVDISRFKGLGEMPAKQLKETTMAPENRTLLRITVPMAEMMARASGETDINATKDELSDIPASERKADVDTLVQNLMGKNAEARFNFIKDNAEFVSEIDV